MKSKVYQAEWLDSADSSIDLRLKHNSTHTEAIVMRAQNLVGQERSLVLAMYQDGKSAADIAKLCNLCPRQVRRMIKNALLRLAEPTFVYVINHKAKWSPTKRKVATCIFQAGLSIRQTADQLNMKIHEVRRHRVSILDQFYRAHPTAQKHQLNRHSTRHTINQGPNRAWKSPPDF